MKKMSLMIASTVEGGTEIETETEKETEKESRTTR